jgi:hypothetical protein
MLTARDLRSVSRGERWHCRVLWLVGFAASLPLAFVARLTGWRWQPWSAGPNGYRSVLSEADSMATQLVGAVYSVY